MILVKVRVRFKEGGREREEGLYKVHLCVAGVKVFCKWSVKHLLTIDHFYRQMDTVGYTVIIRFTCCGDHLSHCGVIMSLLQSPMAPLISPYSLIIIREYLQHLGRYSQQSLSYRSLTLDSNSHSLL